MTSIRTLLMDIHTSGSFDKLESYKEPAVWSTFSQEDRELLAMLLVKQGALQLEQSDHHMLETFQLADQISNQSAEIAYQQGKIFANYPDHLHCLSLACQAFERAIQRNPHFIDAWVEGAETLAMLGIEESEPLHLQKANEWFQTAVTFDFAESSHRLDQFYLNWGLASMATGNLSGEPIDFLHALEKLKQAVALECPGDAVWINQGMIYIELASLLNCFDYVSEALQVFSQAIEKYPLSFKGWFHEGCCLQRLGEVSSNESLLEKADNCFAQAAAIKSDDFLLWLKWGQLDTVLGKMKHDYAKMESSLEKFIKADALEPNHPQVMSCWAETELFLGSQSEDLNLIQSAHRKILKSLIVLSEDVEVWYLYGSVLNELGRYFADEDYYLQAIEKFQYGLTLVDHHPLLWYGLALAQFALGELTGEEVLFEKSVEDCERVLEYGGAIFPQFWNDWGVAMLKLAEITEEASYAELAIEKFEQAFKHPMLDMDKDEVDLEWIYHYGCAYDLLGDLTDEAPHFEKAIQILNQVLVLDPLYIQARYNLALAYAHQGELVNNKESYLQSLEHFSALVEQEPEDEAMQMDYGVTLINLALLLEESSQLEEAQAFYQQAENHLIISAALGNTQTYYQLAGLYSMTGHFEQAMYYLERAQMNGVLPGIDDLINDEWLERVSQTPSFRRFIHELSGRQSLDDK
jgi:tetratricopeptide (TPR) repeat protein